MRLLITGGHGFIGRNLAVGLAGEHVVMSPGRDKLDLLDEPHLHAFLSGNAFDVVIHAATWNATLTSDKDTSLVLDRNLRMFFNLLRSRASYGRLIILGSGAEFSREHWHGRMCESELGIHIPTDDYGLSKFIMARCGKGLPAVLHLRLFGVFGPWEDERIRFISTNICRGLRGEPFVMRQDRRFDYLHVDDVVAAVGQVLERPDLTGRFNLCRGEGHPLSSIVAMIQEALGTNLPVEIESPGEDLEYSGNNAKILHALPGWRPSPLSLGIAHQAEWLRQQMAQVAAHRETPAEGS